MSRPKASYRILSLLRGALVLLILLGVSPGGSLGVSPAWAEVELKWSGRFQTDLRLRTNDISVGRWHERMLAEPGIARNDNAFRLRLVAEADRFTGVAELEFAYYGYAVDLGTFDQLWRQDVVDGFRIRANAAYIEVRDFLFEGLDLRIGQQVIAWGVGDQFNPTNVINALNLEDPLAFGEQLANVMLRADYSPDGNFILSAVMVPIFRPALLPRTAGLGTVLTQRLPFIDSSVRHRVHVEDWFSRRSGFDTVLEELHVVTPERSIENMQWALRIARTVGSHDLALLGYSGRFDMPAPFLNYARIDATPLCNPTAPEECIKGRILTDTALYYPRFWMLGFNASGEVFNPMQLIFKGAKSLGYRFELGVFFPQKVSQALLQGTLDFGGALPTQPSGEYSYDHGRPLVADNTPFAKWVLGLDYTFSEHVYVNMMWVHGFPDEVGAGDFFHEGWSVRDGGFDDSRAINVGQCAQRVLLRNAGGIEQDFSQCAYEILKPRLGDYLVVGTDFKFLNQKALLRLFFIVDLIGVYEERYSGEVQERMREHHHLFTEKGFSAVIFPELTYNFGSGLELSAGAIVKLGKEYSKFGDPAAGGHQIFTRARFSY
ncbi:MAG: hypothetical protein JRH20_00795 [Deltaproteobacteria bacterium]|nr:hypothetical protein [Deltaproteobacteria bacterium]